jgi:hypothetical protein
MIIFSKIDNWLKKRYPGFKFLREYSPKSYDRREILRKIMNFVSECGVAGDYLEFGVYKGATFIEAIKISNGKRLHNMEFYAFDSFQGLPNPSGIDRHSDQFYKGQVSFSQNDFENNLLESGVGGG